jgi:hypothetical protein
VFTRGVRLEAGAFNGAHPDEDRTGVAAPRLDSYGARLALAPNARVAVTLWAAHLDASGGDHPHGAMQRLGAAVQVVRPRPAGLWATTVIYGANVVDGSRRPLHALLVESRLDLTAHHTAFGRVEYVRRSADDLGLTGAVAPELDLAAMSLGYALRGWLGSGRAFTTALGVRGTLHVVPTELEPFYGSRLPVAVAAYLLLRPGGR